MRFHLSLHTLFLTFAPVIAIHTADIRKQSLSTEDVLENSNLKSTQTPNQPETHYINCHESRPPEYIHSRRKLYLQLRFSFNLVTLVRCVY